ncbi:MAG: hypothetical protein J6W60_04195, partial [Treponema sp.]|nr:hypothetical protein [Treponema sp.]
DYGKCPVCGADFSNISDDEIIKNHILQLHTSMDRNKSTLFLVKGSKSYFCCNLCNESEPLYEFQSGRIYRHLFGLCKYYSSSSSSLAITGKNSNDKIWKGSGYSNNSSLLGNSGQILRDNGQFGSHPMEDYYGDGDW